MSYSPSFCSNLFVCAALLCWDERTFQYSFTNIRQCTPKPRYYDKNVYLIPQNNDLSSLAKNTYTDHGFICTNCTQSHFVRHHNQTFNRCSSERTMLQLTNYCFYSFETESKNTSCQCQSSPVPINPIRNWIKALVKPGKSDTNVARVNSINGTASMFVFYLIATVLSVVLFGGLIGIISYWMKWQAIHRKT